MLDEILANKSEEIKAARERMPLEELEALLPGLPAPLSLSGAIQDPGGPLHRVIAEIKRASPSKGVMRGDIEPVDWAKRYARAGAVALSILTDEKFFRGSLTDLAEARKHVRLPLLRKDFILDPYQVYEARAAGADVVLLIVRALGDEQMRELVVVTAALGMEALVEIHEADELDRALDCGARLVGINNRDLKTFTVDIGVTERMMDRIPKEVVVVSASGISRPEQIRSLEARGVRAFLIGEALVTSEDPETTLKELVV